MVCGALWALGSALENRIRESGGQDPLTFFDLVFRLDRSVHVVYNTAAWILLGHAYSIKYHMGQILDRLHLKNRAQVVEYARRAGWTG